MVNVQLEIILLHAVIGWEIVAAMLGISKVITSQTIALILHAIGTPIIFAAISIIYFRKFNFTKPLQTGVIFTAAVFIMDLFLVAIFINHSLAMFGSVLRFWIPYALIFVSTYLTGLIVRQSIKSKYSL